MKLNMNDNVKVKLTQRGKEILQERFEKFHKNYPTSFTKFELPKEDKRGYSKWQLWRLFSVFGEHISMGLDVPFELDIEIRESDDEM